MNIINRSKGGFLINKGIHFNFVKLFSIKTKRMNKTELVKQDEEYYFKNKERIDTYFNENKPIYIIDSIIRIPAYLSTGSLIYSSSFSSTYLISSIFLCNYMTLLYLYELSFIVSIGLSERYLQSKDNNKNLNKCLLPLLSSFALLLLLVNYYSKTIKQKAYYLTFFNILLYIKYSNMVNMGVTEKFVILPKMKNVQINIMFIVSFLVINKIKSNSLK